MMDKITERSAIVGWLKPLSRNAGTYDTDVVDMKLIKRAVVEVLCGAITTTGTLDVTLYGNTSSSTSGGTAITGKSTTDSTFNGSANSDGIARIEVEAAELEAQGLRYLYAEAVVANAAVVFAVTITAFDVRYGDAPGLIPDLAAVREIVY